MSAGKCLLILALSSLVLAMKLKGANIWPLENWTLSVTNWCLVPHLFPASSSALVLWSFFKATHCKKPLYLCLLQRGMFSEMSPIHVVLLSTLMNTPLASVYVRPSLSSVIVALKEKKAKNKFYQLLLILMLFHNYMTFTFLLLWTQKKIFRKKYLSIQWKSIGTKPKLDAIDFQCMDK